MAPNVERKDTQISPIYTGRSIVYRLSGSPLGLFCLSDSAGVSGILIVSQIAKNLFGISKEPLYGLHPP